MNPQHSVLVPRVSSDNKWLIFDILLIFLGYLSSPRLSYAD
jgi:hypothetical protein